MTAPMMTFIEMLMTLRREGLFTQGHIAQELGISPQYLCDLEGGRRRPTVKLVNRISDYLGRGPLGRAEWHRAGARACGWDIGP